MFRAHKVYTRWDLFFFFFASSVLGLDSPRVLEVVSLAGSRWAAAALACVENGVSLQEAFGRQEEKWEEKARERMERLEAKTNDAVIAFTLGVCALPGCGVSLRSVSTCLLPRRRLAWVTARRRSSQPAKRIDIRVTSQTCFLGREAGALALASRAQETSRECIDGGHCGTPRMRKGGEEHRKTHC